MELYLLQEMIGTNIEKISLVAVLLAIITWFQYQFNKLQDKRDKDIAEMQKRYEEHTTRLLEMVEENGKVISGNTIAMNQLSHAVESLEKKINGK